ncbi:unnamed protein product [Gongylonema pulchrum]|uniref:Secreted protein n=1 Tax=Gongylonema pulchrum TaxID=637853 RepID=A0A183EDN4_9BILA|nr:unnamed protein product [Gongylonema pulchrum]
MIVHVIQIMVQIMDAQQSYAVKESMEGAFDGSDMQRTLCPTAEFTQVSLAPLCRQVKNAMKCAAIVSADSTISPVIKAAL